MAVSHISKILGMQDDLCLETIFEFAGLPHITAEVSHEFNARTQSSEAWDLVYARLERDPELRVHFDENAQLSRREKAIKVNAVATKIVKQASDHFFTNPRSRWLLAEILGCGPGYHFQENEKVIAGAVRLALSKLSSLIRFTRTTHFEHPDQERRRLDALNKELDKRLLFPKVEALFQPIQLPRIPEDLVSSSSRIDCIEILSKKFLNNNHVVLPDLESPPDEPGIEPPPRGEAQPPAGGEPPNEPDEIVVPDQQVQAAQADPFELREGEVAPNPVAAPASLWQQAQAFFTALYERFVVWFQSVQDWLSEAEEAR